MSLIEWIGFMVSLLSLFVLYWNNTRKGSEEEKEENHEQPLYDQTPLRNTGDTQTEVILASLRTRPVHITTPALSLPASNAAHAVKDTCQRHIKIQLRNTRGLKQAMLAHFILSRYTPPDLSNDAAYNRP